jgi:hypothetical protein
MLDNPNRIYALASWTVKSNGKGWFVRKTYTEDAWQGPYSSEASVCLIIARQLRKELTKRDGLSVPVSRRGS